MRRILIINTIGLNYEGITTVILNYSQNMKREGMEFEFVAFENCNSKLKATFEQIGKVNVIANRKEDTIAYSKALKRIIQSSNYDLVHIHGNSGTMALEVLICKICRIKNILVHCHSTRCSHPVLNRLLKGMMMKGATGLMACSENAGKWLYGKKTFSVLNNAIDTQRFVFSESVRVSIRSELGLNNSDFVIGHSGHFTEVKNQDFLIDIIEILKQKVNNVKLLLLSDGPRMNLIKDKVKQKKLDNYVLFVGRTEKPEKYYQAMDVFTFPSKWEGLGLALVEAQCSGMPCIASTGVPRKADVSNSVRYLDFDIDSWCNEILIIMNQKNSREEKSRSNIVKIKQNSFDIHEEVKKLEKIYRYGT